MATTTTKAAPKTRATKLIDGYYATPTGIKATARGKVLDPGHLFGNVGKGYARRLRKALRSAGFAGHASAARS